MKSAPSACPNGCQRTGGWELWSDEPGFKVLRCSSCGLGWTDPVLGDEAIGEYYPPSWYGKNNARFNPVFEYLVRLFRLRRSRVIRHRSHVGKVLDVGCGRGLILNELQQCGYKAYGVEISEHAAWHAQKKIGPNIHVGDFEGAPFPEDAFEVVIFWHSLEHFRDPSAALKKANRLLKKGGLLVVAVPNSDSIQAKLTGRNWFHLDIPRHYFHFGLKSLEDALKNNNFRVVQADHFSFEQNPYGWLQSLYNALGFQFNFLYNWLKTRSSRATPLQKHPIQSLAIFILMPFLLPLALVLTVFEAAVEKGGTIELYAKKTG